MPMAAIAACKLPSPETQPQSLVSRAMSFAVWPFCDFCPVLLPWHSVASCIAQYPFVCPAQLASFVPWSAPGVVYREQSALLRPDLNLTACTFWGASPYYPVAHYLDASAPVIAMSPIRPVPKNQTAAGRANWNTTRWPCLTPRDFNFLITST